MKFRSAIQIKKTLTVLYNILSKAYGPQGWWPIKGRYFPETHDVFEVIVGSVLTQNTAWKNVEKALQNLRNAHLLSPKTILQTDGDVLAHRIKSSGYYNQKAQRLKEIARFITPYLQRHTIPSRTALLAVHGIGNETADSILLYAFHIPIFVVDAYTTRLMIRLGICKENSSYSDIQTCFMQSLPHDERLFNEYHALIVKHGKDICKRNPLCDICTIRVHGLCSYTPDLHQ